MLEKLQVGVIASMHGLKGEVNVFPTTDDANRFTKLKSVFIEEKGIRRDLEIESVRYFKGRPIVKFRGLDRIEDVQKARLSSSTARTRFRSRPASTSSGTWSAAPSISRTGPSWAS